VGAILTAGSLDLNFVGPYELTYPPYGMFMTIAGPNSEKHLLRAQFRPIYMGSTDPNQCRVAASR
jgi:hypothetical protein